MPAGWDGWVVHGHHHDNDTETYPFVHFDARRVNVGAELLDYRPVALDDVTAVLAACSAGDYLRDVDAAVTQLA